MKTGRQLVLEDRIFEIAAQLEATNEEMTAALEWFLQSASAYVDHRGWRFHAPFFCFYCGRRISLNQFCFSRSCGSCDCAHTGTRRLNPMRGKAFSGKRERLPDWRSGDIPADHFIDIADESDAKKLYPDVQPSAISN
jgi:hypothetical protein